MARDRTSVDEAYPGDVIGLFDPGIFRIGDTLSDEGNFTFEGIPSFPPEHFVRVRVAEVLRRKSLEKGLLQLTQEGLVQLFTDPDSGSAAPLLGAIGPLQFDVLKFRMQAEYNVEMQLDPLPYRVARWIRGTYDPEVFRYASNARVVDDREGRKVLLLERIYSLNHFEKNHPELELAETPYDHQFDPVPE
jgi:peptide chain release factor 3